MSSEFQSDRIKSDFLNLTFVANDYEINFDKLSEGEEDDQYTGKFRVRSRSVPARRSKEEGMASRRSSSIGEGRKSEGNDRSSNIPQRQGISMVFSEDEMRDSLTGRRHSSMVSGTARGSKSSVRASLSDNEPAQRLSRITEETISSSGASQTEASEEWCTKSLTSRTLQRGKKDPGDAIDPKKMDVIVTAQDTVGLDTVPLVEVRSALVGPDGAGGDVRSHGSMEWIPGQTLHFDVPKEVNKDVEIHLELLPFANPPQGIIDGKMLLNAAEKYEQVQLSSGALGLHVRMKPSKQRGNKKGLKWHPEVRDGKSFTGSNRRNTPFQPLVPIAESEARLSEARTSDGRMSRSMLEDPRMSEARISDGRMSAADPRMSEARMSDGRMSAADPRMSEARMSDGRMSAADPQMSEARMSDGRMSAADPRMSEARMSDGRMSAANPQMSEARMSNGRTSAADPRMSEARMSDGRMSARMSGADPRMSEARMSDGRMSAADPRMSGARMSDGRMSAADPRMSEARMSGGRMSAADPRMSEARMSDGRMSAADPRMSDGRMSARMSEADPRMSEATMSDGSMSRSMLEDPPMSEARMSDGRMSAADPRMSGADPRMSEARMSDGRMSARMSAADSRMAEARMSDGRMSAADPRMSEARMSDGRMSAADPRMSEARMSDGRMSARMSGADPRMSEARMSDGRMSAADPRMSEARMSDGRMSAADPRMSEARMSDGRMSARMSEDRWVSDSRMSNGRISNVRMSEARLSDLSEPDLRSSPSLASMQLDVSDLEPRPSCGISTGRRSTVRMQQDPSEASDTPSSDAARQSAGASLNHVGKLSLEAQSGSLFGTLPRSSVRSMQVASSESDSGSGSIGSPGVTTVTPMATIAEDRGTELSSKSARNSMKSRASRLGRRTSDTLPLPGARAVCRFTHPKSVDFCGLELMACQCQAEPLAGRDRSALLVLLEQAAKSVEAARQMKGDASAMPRILAQLSSELTLHGRELRVGRLQTVGVEPVALAVLSQLIEVLDTLVPKANESHENSLVLGHDGSMGGEAKPPYTESLLESLRQAFGPHGFLPEVVECLHSQPQLPAAAAEQLKIQCLLSLRLAAAWETPSSVQKPMELVIQQKGCEVLIQQLEELICRLKKGDGSTTVIAQLGLALEIQQLLLCSDLGLEQLCDTFTKARSGATRRETPLATIALETLEILAQQNWQASPVAISTVLPAAVNILALLLNATPVALTASTDQVVRALCELISHETMTPRFISAMLQLVRSPPKPRIWLGSVSNAVQIRKKLRQGLIRNKVPSMVAIAAKEKLAALLQQYGDALLRLDDAGPVSKAVEKRASQVIAAGSYYDTVEVYGNLGPVEEEMADFRSAVEDLDDDISRAERRRSSTLVSALSTMRQAIFENCLMPQTRRRSSRGL